MGIKLNTQWSRLDNLSSRVSKVWISEVPLYTSFTSYMYVLSFQYDCQEAMCSHFHYMYDSSHTKPPVPYTCTGQTNYHVLGVFQEHGIVHSFIQSWKFLKPWQQGTSCVAQLLLVLVTITYLQDLNLLQINQLLVIHQFR